jgi:hypothetical protein
MKTKIVTAFFISALVCIFICGCPTPPQDPYESGGKMFGDFRCKKEAGTISILQYYGKDKDLIIPEKIDKLPVTKIADYAFWDCKLMSVKIPETVKIIEQFAFSENNLVEIVIPEGVVDIGGSAFFGNQISNLVIPNSVVNIGRWAFSKNQISNLVLSTNVTVLNKSVFYSNQLKEINIANVKSIGLYVFGNNLLEKVTIGANVYMNNWSFDYSIYNPTNNLIYRFREFYDKNDKKAGTYVRLDPSSDEWVFQEGE